ncbi:unnamed protein product [Gordionus sp. m RMFG-2023]
MKYTRYLYSFKIFKNYDLGHEIILKNQSFLADSHTNLTNNILSLTERNLIHQPYHPLNLIKSRIINYFYKTFINYKQSPIYSICDNINPIVSLEENFDDILIPKNHSSRKLSESYYINSKYLLRTHTSAHQIPLIKSGLDSFLIAGDVYRRDAIDSKHYPVFHQMEGVKLYSRDELFYNIKDDSMILFPLSDKLQQKRNEIHQEWHTIEASKILEFHLKNTLLDMIKYLFKKDLEIRWVDAYFPFTHPSWELEIKFENEYMEILGCGIMEQKILNQAGAHNKVGWAFGLGLERLAMLLYGIPDIRLFWSQDSGFLSQFKTDDCEKTIKMKPISKFPQCINDVSFWLPPNQELFDTNDFLEMIRNITSIAESEFDEIETMFDEPSTVLNDLMSNNRFKHSNNAKDSLAKKLVPKKDETCNNGGNKLAQERRIDIVEQVQLMDEYKDAKSGRISLCYRIIYRHPTKTLTKELVNRFHRKIEKALETDHITRTI